MPSLEPVVLRLVRLAHQIEDGMLPGRGERRGLTWEVGLQRRDVHRGDGEPEHQPARPPVGEVQVQVEVAGQQLGGVSLQVTPMVLVPEPCRRDLGPRGDAAKLRQLPRGQRAVKRDELVGLVFAHTTPTSRLRIPATNRSPAVSATSSATSRRTRSRTASPQPIRWAACAGTWRRWHETSPGRRPAGSPRPRTARRPPRQAPTTTGSPRTPARSHGRRRPACGMPRPDRAPQPACPPPPAPVPPTADTARTATGRAAAAPPAPRTARRGTAHSGTPRCRERARADPEQDSTPSAPCQPGDRPLRRHLFGPAQLTPAVTQNLDVGDLIDLVGPPQPRKPPVTGFGVGRRGGDDPGELLDSPVHRTANGTRGAVHALKCRRHPLEEQHRAVASKNRVRPRHLLDLGGRLPDPPDRRLRPPPERAPTKSRREHPPMPLSPRHPTTPAPHRDTPPTIPQAHATLPRHYKARRLTVARATA